MAESDLVKYSFAALKFELIIKVMEKRQERELKTGGSKKYFYISFPPTNLVRDRLKVSSNL